MDRLPTYAAITPTTGPAVPADLVAHERADAFLARQASMRNELIGLAGRPGEDIALLTVLLGAGGVVAGRLRDAGERCCLVFSTQLRASIYVRDLLSSGPEVQYLSANPLEFLRLLREVEQTGIYLFVLDHCPRCEEVEIVASESLRTAEEVVEGWATRRAKQLARVDLYHGYAVEAARSGRLELARDVALATVAHVSPDDPRLHRLLGTLALALDERPLLDEARTFLECLDQPGSLRELNRLERSGRPGPDNY